MHNFLYYPSRFLAILYIFAMFATPVFFAHAQQCGTAGQPDCPPAGTVISLPNPTIFGDVPSFLQALLEIVQIIAIPIVVFFIIYAGFLFVTAQGNPAKLSQARQALLAAAIGAVIVLGAWVIATVIKNTVDDIRS